MRDPTGQLCSVPQGSLLPQNATSQGLPVFYILFATLGEIPHSPETIPDYLRSCKCTFLCIYRYMYVYFVQMCFKLELSQLWKLPNNFVICFFPQPALILCWGFGTSSCQWVHQAWVPWKNGALLWCAPKDTGSFSNRFKQFHSLGRANETCRCILESASLSAVVPHLKCFN